jgi:nitroreductase
MSTGSRRTPEAETTPSRSGERCGATPPVSCQPLELGHGDAGHRPARRNVRQYTDQPIPRDGIERILEAGRRAPSASDWQPSNFVVVTDRDQLVELAKAWPRGGGTSPGPWRRSPSWPRPPEEERQGDLLQYDIGQATATMMVTAADLGIGSGHSAVTDQEQAQRVLGFPGGHFAVYLIGLGYPADRPLAPVTNPGRRRFADVVRWGHW